MYINKRSKFLRTDNSSSRSAMTQVLSQTAPVSMETPSTSSSSVPNSMASPSDQSMGSQMSSTLAGGLNDAFNTPGSTPMTFATAGSPIGPRKFMSKESRAEHLTKAANASGGGQRAQALTINKKACKNLSEVVAVQ